MGNKKKKNKTPVQTPRTPRTPRSNPHGVKIGTPSHSPAHFNDMKRDYSNSPRTPLSTHNVSTSTAPNLHVVLEKLTKGFLKTKGVNAILISSMLMTKHGFCCGEDVLVECLGQFLVAQIWSADVLQKSNSRLQVGAPVSKKFSPGLILILSLLIY